MEQYDGLEGRGDDDELIHVPMRSRASVLQERNLLRLLEEEREEEDAPEALARWARGRDSRRDGRSPRRRGPATIEKQPRWRREERRGRKPGVRRTTERCGEFPHQDGFGSLFC